MGVGMVGAWALHELVEVAQKVLLGLLAHVISHGNQRGVGRSTAIFSILFPLYVEGPHPDPGAWPCLCLGLRWSATGVALFGCIGQRLMVPGHLGWDSGCCYECFGSARAAHVQAVGAERPPSQDEAHMRPPVPRSVAIAVSGWSDSSGASPLP